jgi:hypothetical protein
MLSDGAPVLKDLELHRFSVIRTEHAVFANVCCCIKTVPGLETKATK